MKLRNAFALMILVTVCGCGDKKYNEKKTLIQAVDKFYTAIIKKDLSQIYGYFPDEFKNMRNKEEFLKLTSEYPPEDIMNAFSLLAISRYEIKEIQPLSDGTYEVTTIIHSQNPPQMMKDIMKWKKSGETWENISYEKLVSNLIQSVQDKQVNTVEQIMELRKCKNQIQKLTMAVWDYLTAKKYTYAEFKTIQPEKWAEILQKENCFIDGNAPKCPSDGEFTVKYNTAEKKLVIECSKHTSIALPFEFTALSEQDNTGKTKVEPENVESDNIELDNAEPVNVEKENQG